MLSASPHQVVVPQSSQGAARTRGPGQALTLVVVNTSAGGPGRNGSRTNVRVGDSPNQRLGCELILPRYSCPATRQNHWKPRGPIRYCMHP